MPASRDAPARGEARVRKRPPGDRTRSSEAPITTGSMPTRLQSCSSASSGPRPLGVEPGPSGTGDESRLERETRLPKAAPVNWIAAQRDSSTPARRAGADGVFRRAPTAGCGREGRGGAAGAPAGAASAVARASSRADKAVDNGGRPVVCPSGRRLTSAFRLRRSRRRLARGRVSRRGGIGRRPAAARDAHLAERGGRRCPARARSATSDSRAPPPTHRGRASGRVVSSIRAAGSRAPAFRRYGAARWRTSSTPRAAQVARARRRHRRGPAASGSPPRLRRADGSTAEVEGTAPPVTIAAGRVRG